jgi:NAD-dependent dihydropyrimidine dehydrogenase PreA subunit
MAMAVAMSVNMPLRLKLKLYFSALFYRNNKGKRMAVMREIGSRRKFTVPRDQIEWFPAVDTEKCTGCMICHDFCPKNVFSEDKNNKTVVVFNPYSCVVLCTGCIPKCKQDAITFPDRKEFNKFIRYE